MAGTLMAHSGADLIGREELALVPPPKQTYSHKPIPHIEIVESLEKVLSEVHFSIKREEFALSKDKLRMFGVLDLAKELTADTSVSIGIRNGNDRTMALGMTAGYRVFICDNMAFVSDFQPIFVRHVHSMSLIEAVAFCVQQLQEAIPSMQEMITSLMARELSDRGAKEIIYDAFTSREFGLPQTLFREIHESYFKTQIEEFKPRNLWTLSNAFTTAFKKLAPIQKFTATAKLSDFLKRFK
jgi:hypothetical protein